MKVWVDADACPKAVKNIIFKAAQKRSINVHLVANSYFQIPSSKFIQLEVVSAGFDVADHFIVEHVKPEDLVITADIPLADLVIKKGSTALNPRGELYTVSNIAEKLSTRNLMQELREGGVVSGGPKSFSDKDKQNFANSFDRIVTEKVST